MRQINNGYIEKYYLDEDGSIIDIISGRKLKIDCKHCYRLQTVDGRIKKVPLKRLYREIYNREYCVDRIISLDKEQQKEIVGTEGVYYISNYGRVKSYAKYEAIILQPTITAAGYERLQIRQNGEFINKFVHRLVAAAFLPMPKSIDYQLHHIDFNKRNNKADNLVQLSIQEHNKIHTEGEKENNE